MEKYILILLTILVLLVIAVVYFGYRELNHIRVSVNKNSSNVAALQSYLTNHGNSFFTTNQTMENSHYKNTGNSNPQFPDDVDDTEDPDNYYEEEEEEEEEYYENFDNEENEENNGKEEINSDDDVIVVNPEDAVPQQDEKDSKKEIEDTQETVFEEQSEKVNEENQEYEKEMKKLDEVMNQDEEKNSDMFDTIDETKTVEIPTRTPSKSKKTSPSQLARDFDVGYKIQSDNDHQMYEVVANKNGHKRWKLIK